VRSKGRARFANERVARNKTVNALVERSSGALGGRASVIRRQNCGDSAPMGRTLLWRRKCRRQRCLQTRPRMI
jgi:hypothetical protein